MLPLAKYGQLTPGLHGDVMAGLNDMVLGEDYETDQP